MKERVTRREWCGQITGILLSGGFPWTLSGKMSGTDGSLLRAQEPVKKDPWGDIPDLLIDRDRIQENLRKEPEYERNETLTRDGYQTGTIVVSRWRFGMRIEAIGDEFRKIRASTIVPARIEDEQEVLRGETDVSDGASISFRNLTDARQMRIYGQILLDGRTLRAIQEMTIHRILWPKPTDVRGLQIPVSSQLPIPQRKYLKPEKLIESENPVIAAAAKRITEDMKSFYPTDTNAPDVTGTDWRKVEEIYDWTRRQIRYEDNRGQTPYGAVETLRKGVGDCDEITYLFVALCRFLGIPARQVQVPDHCYPEFAMVDESGKLRWYPCQSAGTRAFGEMPDGRPIIGKGDQAMAQSPVSGTSRNRQGGRLRPVLVCERISEEPPVPFDPESFDTNAYAAAARASSDEKRPGNGKRDGEGDGKNGADVTVPGGRTRASGAK
ncbi:MAG: transglutaminase-like domain-containing protein [Planctomycetia bacterium]|nr:transglutaminase-like domain-containing protein [Planctomycetia bacterium]